MSHGWAKISLTCPLGWVWWCLFRRYRHGVIGGGWRALCAQGRRNSIANSSPGMDVETFSRSIVGFTETDASLSDRTRWAILLRLCEGGASVGTLTKPFEMALPSLMKHIRILERSGRVASEKTGRVRTCSLQTDALVTGDVWLAGQREVWGQRVDRLEIWPAVVYCADIAASVQTGHKTISHTNLHEQPPGNGCEPKLWDRVHASPSLPGLTRQPALQRQGAGCRIKSGNDGEARLSFHGESRGCYSAQC